MNVIVRNVRLIDGTGAGPFPRVTVDVRNGLIRSVGEGSTGPRSHVAGEDIRASI
jgi:N-acyl-D-aspartate/D-glutamate deacylase